MLCTLNEMLPHARRHGYAVTAFDFVHDIYVRPILDTCEAKRAPVIMSALPHDIEGRGLEYTAGLVRAVASSYSVPICLHLDHSPTFEIIKRCIGAGFTSVMFDGSHYPFAENVARTREVVAYAHARGVTVEAELGFVAGNDLEGGDTGDIQLTEPREVAEFVEKTEVDALAVSIGTAHGVYKSTPTLDIDRLGEIIAACAVPLVLHGGSGTPEDQLVAAIKGGITKLNIYTDIRLAMNARFAQIAAMVEKRADEIPDRVFAPLYEGLAEEVAQKLDLTMSAGRY